MTKIEACTIQVYANGYSASGSIIGRGLFLTARHLGENLLKGADVDVFLPADSITSRQEIKAKVEWLGGEDCDAALLVAENIDEISDDVEILRLGYASIDQEGRVSGWPGISTKEGWKEASYRRFETGCRSDQCDNSEYRINTDSAPENKKKWKGVSGGPVIFSSNLVGLVRRYHMDLEAKSLVCVKIQDILKAAGFKEIYEQFEPDAFKREESILESLKNQMSDELQASLSEIIRGFSIDLLVNCSREDTNSLVLKLIRSGIRTKEFCRFVNSVFTYFLTRFYLNYLHCSPADLLKIGYEPTAELATKSPDKEYDPAHPGNIFGLGDLIIKGVPNVYNWKEAFLRRLYKTIKKQELIGDYNIESLESLVIRTIQRKVAFNPDEKQIHYCYLPKILLSGTDDRTAVLTFLGDFQNKCPDGLLFFKQVDETGDNDFDTFEFQILTFIENVGDDNE